MPRRAGVALLVVGLIAVLCTILVPWGSTPDPAPATPSGAKSPQDQRQERAPSAREGVENATNQDDATRGATLTWRFVDGSGSTLPDVAVHVRVSGAGTAGFVEERVTNESGRFRCEAPVGSRVELELVDAARWKVSTDSLVWESANTHNEFEVVLFRRPGRLLLTVHDVSTDAPVQEFECSVSSADWEASGSTAEGRVVIDLPPIDDGATRWARVTIKRPASRFEPEHWFEIPPYGPLELCLAIQSGDTYRGTVRDADGNPVEGALVFTGNQIRLRGDEPFKPFAPSRIRDGVRTDKDGKFEIVGVARRVTVYSSRLSVRTIENAEPSAFTLGPLETVRLRFADTTVVPRGSTVKIDRTRTEVVGTDGVLRLENLSYGVRGLQLYDDELITFTHEPGGPADVNVGTWLRDVRINLSALEQDRFASDIVALVALDRVGSLKFGPLQAGQFDMDRVLPGRYTLLGRGAVLFITIDTEGRSSIRPGTGTVRVHGETRGRVYIVRAGASEFEHLMAGRVGAVRGPSSSAAIEFTGLPAGRYEIGVDRLGRYGSVELKDSETIDLRLDREE